MNTHGHQCYLKSEHESSRVIDLKLIRWNDSSLVEMVDNEVSENDYYQADQIDYDNSNSSSDDNSFSSSSSSTAAVMA